MPAVPPHLAPAGEDPPPSLPEVPQPLLGPAPAPAEAGGGSLMARYAQRTTVSAAKSKAEIEKLVSRYGATQFIQGWQEGHARIAFRCSARLVQFDLPMPDVSQFMEGPSGRTRSSAGSVAAHEQEVRRRWRALALVIKAKLEAVETGVTTFEQEFLAHIVLPNGQTVGDTAIPAIEHAYATGKVRALLPERV